MPQVELKPATDLQRQADLQYRADSQREALAAWLFLAPAIALLGIFVLYPIAYLGYLSLTTGSFTRAGVHWIGLRNYERLLADADFWQVLGNTAYFTIATVIPSLLIPLGLAVLLNRAIALRDVLRTAYFIPAVTSLVAAGLGFRWLFQTDGVVNGLLSSVGISAIPWLGSVTWAMPVLILRASGSKLGSI
jgi:multiple sugar transport system permease protein